MNKAITYLIKKQPIRESNINDNYFDPKVHQRGYAFEIDDFFIHIPAHNESNLVQIHPEISLIEKKSNSLKNWVEKNFAAKEIKNMALIPGEYYENIWRPSFHDLSPQNNYLEIDLKEKNVFEDNLKSVLSLLDTISDYINPTKANLNCFSLKNRELIILACTSVEALFKKYIPEGEGTSSYIKLKEPLLLDLYSFAYMKSFSSYTVFPFKEWTEKKPTKSISWYYDYNCIKHDFFANLSQAKLSSCLESVCAYLLLNCIRYSPDTFFDSKSMTSILTYNHFALQYLNDEIFTNLYLPKPSFPPEFLSQVNKLKEVDLTQFKFEWTKKI